VIDLKCKIRITKEIAGHYQQYQPKVGKVYDAEYRESTWKQRNIPPICVINIAGKRITIRQNEFEIVGEEDGK
jgi:hypothetical protein